MNGNAVELRSVSKTYREQSALKDVTLAVDAGTFAVIFGPPGCGKSVILRLLTGLEKPTAGQIFMRGSDVTNASPGERNIGYVPQMFALYPHYRVYDNIAYPLTLISLPKSEIDPLVHRAANMLRIDHLLQKTPDQLSGGEKQRVALARGIVKKTEIYVLDDPLTGLDFKLREQLFDDLKDTQESLNATFIYTTSDPLETLILAEHVYVMDGGRLIESGPLEQVYAAPKHVRTMELLGFPRANLLPGTLSARGGQMWCKTNLFEFRAGINPPAHVSAEQKGFAVAVRPQDLQLNPDKTSGLLTFRAQVVLQEDLGSELVMHLEADTTPLVAVVRHDDIHPLGDGAVTVGIPPSAMVLYATENGQRIGQGAE